MMPEEWPIAAPPADQNAPARAAGRGRLPTVRVDFFLNPAERLSEQERALMTAMLYCLVSDIADEIRASLPAGWAAANDESNSALVEALSTARLLDEPALVALLLRRADEERIATAAKARAGRREARALQGLVSHDSGAVSAAAMALILARGRRRDRFGQCLLSFDDLPAETSEALAQAVAAVLRTELAATHGSSAADAELADAIGRVLEGRDPARSIDSLTAELVAQLSEAGPIGDDLILAAAHEGEIGFVAEAIARHASLPGESTIEELLSGDAQRIMALFRVAGFSRDLSAGLLAGIGDLLGIADAAQAIAIFDRLTDGETQAAWTWLGTAPGYRAALSALGGRSRG